MVAKGQVLLKQAKIALSKGKVSDAKKARDEIARTMVTAKGREREELGMTLAEAIYDVGYYYYDRNDLPKLTGAAAEAKRVWKMFPASELAAKKLLNLLKGLINLKYRSSEFRMPVETASEVKEIVTAFPRNDEIALQCAACYANLVSLCAAGDVPAWQMYQIIDDLGELAQQFKDHDEVFMVYARALATVCLKLKERPDEPYNTKYRQLLMEVSRKKDLVLPDELVGELN